MLYNLDFLNTGKFFPPECGKNRLELYAKNKMLFEGLHEEVYRESFKRIQRVINNWQDVISYAIIANYHKLITKKTADLLLGEPPKIISGKKGSKEQNTIDIINEKTKLTKTLYMAAMDISRYGDGVLILYKDKD